MKTCPKCKMTFDACCECPACNNDITQQPYSDREVEKYVFNRYFFIWAFRNAKTFLLCLISLLMIFIINWNGIEFSHLLSLICLIFCFGETFYPSFMYKIWSSFYSDNYLEATTKITKYASAFLAVFVAWCF